MPLTIHRARPLHWGRTGSGEPRSGRDSWLALGPDGASSAAPPAPLLDISTRQFRVFDLATLWREFTGFGFVFAMWMARAEDAGRIRQLDFAGARKEGLAHLHEIAADYEKQVSLTSSEIKQYLTHNIAFSMDDEMQKGLALFFELSDKYKLIEGVKSLEFI